MPSKTGTAARMASVKKRLMIVGGDLGSARKMWWISGLFEYRSGGDGTAGGALWSGWMLRSKVCRLNGVDEPNDASTMEALRGLLLVRSWYGKSFCVYSHIGSA